jgi:hypothetical protein
LIAAYSRMLRLVILLGAALPVIVGINSGILSGKSEGYWVKVGVAVALLAVLAWSLGRARKRLEEVLEGLGREQTEHLDGLRGRWSEVAVLGSAALSLFLELAVIRWQGTVWEFFSFYKNLGLLSCFAGLGLGYAIARSERLPLLLTAPLLAFQALLFITLRHGLDEIIDSLLQLPFKEQETMGIPIAATLSHYASSYSLIVVTFLLTALAFLPLGQLCGRVREHAVDTAGHLVSRGIRRSCGLPSLSDQGTGNRGLLCPARRRRALLADFGWLGEDLLAIPAPGEGSG